MGTAGDLSPRSRTSITWQQEWPIKPDVVLKRKAAAQTGFVFDEGKGLSTKEQQYDPTSIINEVRGYVDAWRLRSARALGALDRLDDLAVARVATDPPRFCERDHEHPDAKAAHCPCDDEMEHRHVSPNIPNRFRAPVDRGNAVVECPARWSQACQSVHCVGVARGQIGRSHG